jgi:hypothetical protein
VFLSLGDLTHPLFALLEALTHWSIPNGGLLARHHVCVRVLQCNIILIPFASWLLDGLRSLSGEIEQFLRRGEQISLRGRRERVVHSDSQTK